MFRPENSRGDSQDIPNTITRPQNEEENVSDDIRSASQFARE
jgi:hypothetical protein